MTTHIMALTYQPKIEAVKSGWCRQTIRLLNKEEILPSDIRQRLKRPGDEILLHTWEGRPYRSKWDWRARYLVTEVLQIWCDNEGFWRHSLLDSRSSEWVQMCPHIERDDLMDIVRRDHIDPPTIEEWERTLMRLNRLDHLEGTDWEVIRWGPFESEIASDASGVR